MDTPAASTDPRAQPPETIFQDLVDALEAQLEQARRGDVDGVLGLAGRVDGLLERARQTGACSDPDRHRRLLDLHAHIRLALAQQMDDVARRRVSLARGKRSVGAYRDASG